MTQYKKITVFFSMGLLFMSARILEVHALTTAHCPTIAIVNACIKNNSFQFSDQGITWGRIGGSPNTSSTGVHLLLSKSGGASCNYLPSPPSSRGTVVYPKGIVVKKVLFSKCTGSSITSCTFQY